MMDDNGGVIGNLHASIPLFAILYGLCHAEISKGAVPDDISHRNPART